MFTKFLKTFLPSLLILCSFNSYSFFADISNQFQDLIFETFTRNLYEKIDFDGEPVSYNVFELGLKGYLNFQNEELLSDKKVITLIDFSLPSTTERLWLVDLEYQKVLQHTLVAHGRNSGENFANRFSNIPQSYQSSLGFYITSNTYHGKHGLSLRLDGVEKGINHNARNRAIVLHGADYVSYKFINQHGRLGRSYGCPSVPMDLHKEIISEIADKTCMFIYHPSEWYHEQSNLMNAVVEWESNI